MGKFAHHNKMNSFSWFIKNAKKIVPESPQRFSDRVIALTGSVSEFDNVKSDVVFSNTFIKGIFTCLSFLLTALSGGDSANLLTWFLRRPSNKNLRETVLNELVSGTATDNAILKCLANDVEKISRNSPHVEQNYKSRLIRSLKNVVKKSSLIETFGTSYHVLNGCELESGDAFNPKRGRKSALDTHSHVLEKFSDYTTDATVPNPRRSVVVNKENTENENFATPQKFRVPVKELEEPFSHLVAKSGLQKHRVEGGSPSEKDALSFSTLRKYKDPEVRSCQPMEMMCPSCLERDQHITFLNKTLKIELDHKSNENPEKFVPSKIEIERSGKKLRLKKDTVQKCVQVSEILFARQIHFNSRNRNKAFRRKIENKLKNDQVLCIFDFAENVKTGRSKIRSDGCERSKGQYTLFGCTLIHLVDGKKKHTYVNVFSEALDHSAWTANEISNHIFDDTRVKKIMKDKSEFICFTDCGKHLNCGEAVRFPLHDIPKKFPNIRKAWSCTHCEHHGKDCCDCGFNIVVSAIRAIEKTFEGFMGKNIERDIELIHEHLDTVNLTRLLNLKEEIDVILLKWESPPRKPADQMKLVGFNLESSYARVAVRSENTGKIQYYDHVFGDRKKGVLLETACVQTFKRPQDKRKVKIGQKPEEPVISPKTELQRKMKRDQMISLSLSKSPKIQQKSSEKSQISGTKRKIRSWSVGEILQTFKRVSQGGYYPTASMFQGSDYRAWQLSHGKHAIIRETKIRKVLNLK